MVKKGTTVTRRGRKPATMQHNGESGSPQVPKQAVIKKTRAFNGKLAHTSPVPEKKITGYFSPNMGEVKPENQEETSKTLALQRVFGKLKGAEKEPMEVSPHKIVLKEPKQEEIDEKEVKDEPLVKIVKEEEKLSEATNSKSKPTKAKKKLNVNQSSNQEENHKLTEYFAVRRSVRKPKTALLEEKQRDLEEAVEAGREDGLEIINFPGKGRGIVATRLFRRGEFVVEYAGDLIDLVEARHRERLYSADQNTGCYMYYFHHKDTSYCVDATAESDRLGRLVNHSRTNGNLMPKIIEIKDSPRLLLVAKVDIMPGEELLYDYGDRSKVSLKHHPWLAT